MSIKVNFNTQQGAVKTLIVNAKANKALVTSLPNEPVWIEFIDEATGVAPKKMTVKRQGNDLWLSFDEENEPELIITDYYLLEEPAALLGLGSDGAYHAYVSELATSQLSVQQLTTNTLTPVILAQESVNLAPLFASWSGALKGVGVALGAGLVAALASGGGSGGGQGEEEKPVAGVKFIPQEAGNGGLKLVIPTEAQKVVLKVVPADKTQPVEIVLVKQGDKFVVEGGDSPVKIDIKGNEVSIDEKELKDNSNASAVVFDGKNKASEPVNVKTGYDETTNEHAKVELDKIVDVPNNVPNTVANVAPKPSKAEITAKIKESIDTSSPLDQDPETFVIEGYTAKGATVTVTDSKGNVLGSTTADPQTGFYNFTVTQGKDNVKVDDKLTVTTKLDGYAPSTQDVVVPAVTRHTGDAVGPETPPTVDVTKEKDIEIKTNFDGKGKGEKVAEVAVKYTDLEGNEQNVSYTYDPEKNQLTSSEPSILPSIPLKEGQDPNTITIPREKLPPNGVIEVVSKDLAGNPSEPTKAKVTPPAEDSTLPEVTPAAQDNGNVEIPLPPATDDKVKSLIVTFEKQPTPPTDGSAANNPQNQPQAQPETVTLKLVKDENGNWKVDETDPNSNTNKDLITITDGKVTIPAGNVADGSIVTATPVNNEGSKGATSQTEAKPDESAVTPAPKFTQLIAINDKNPATEEATRLKFTIKTEPNATVEVFNKDGKLIAKGKANEQGIFEKEIGESDSKELVSGEGLTAKATAPNKRPSTEAAKLVEGDQEVEVKIPEVTQFTDNAAPKSPTIDAGKAGNTPIKVTPAEPLEEGDTLSIVVPNTTGKEETLAFKVVNGKLTPVENTGTEPSGVKYKLNGNTVEIDRTSVAPDAPITANTKDIANNLSGMVTDNTGFTAQTTQPKVTSITSKDNSKKADDNPEIFTLEGEAPAGSMVKVYDKNGNLLGTTKAGENGKFTLSDIVEHKDCDMKVGDQFTVVAQKVDENGKPTEAESQPVKTTVTAPPAGKEGHTDNIAPEQATLTVKPNGDLSVELPKQAVKGDSVEVVVKDGNDKEIGKATLTSDGQGNWTSNNPSLVPNVTAADNNIATIPNAKVPNGSKVSVTSQDLAGNKAESTNLDVTKPTERSEKPTVENIRAMDGNLSSDGVADYVEISGKAKAGDTITVYDSNNNAVSTVKVGDDGNFKVVFKPEDPKAIAEGKTFTVTATSEDKLESEKADKLSGTGTDNSSNNQPIAVPKLKEKVDFLDSVPPAKADIGEVTADGKVPVHLDPQATDGTTYTFKVPTANGETPVVLTKKGDIWESNNTDLIPHVQPADNHTALIPTEKLAKDGEIKVVGKDLAGNESAEEKQQVPATAKEKSEAPTELVIKALDRDTEAKVGANPEAVEISGKAKKGDTVTVEHNGKVLGSVKVTDENGTFSLTVNELGTENGDDLVTGSPLTITATSEGKEKSDPAQTTKDGGDVKVPSVVVGKNGGYLDSTPPAQPVVETQTDEQGNNTNVITAGEGEAVNGIELTFTPKKETSSGNAGENAGGSTGGNSGDSSTPTEPATPVTVKVERNPETGKFESSNPKVLPNDYITEENGKPVIKIPASAVEPGTGIKAQATDLAGNSSEPTETVAPPAKVAEDAPNPPTVRADKDNIIIDLPLSPKADDKVIAKVIPTGQTEPVDITLTYKDGKWVDETPRTEGNSNIPTVKINSDGTATIPNSDVADGSLVSAHSQNSAGDKQSNPSSIQAPAEQPSTPATITKATLIDTSAEADKVGDELRLEGEAEKGSTVIVYDKEGNELGRGVANEEGKFNFVVNVAGKGLTPNSTEGIQIVTENPNKVPTKPTALTKAIEADLEFTDKQPLEKAALVDNGTDTVAKLPADAPTGTTFKLTVNGKDATDGSNPKLEVTFTKQADGTWKSDKPNEIADIKPTDSNHVVIPNSKLAKDDKVTLTLTDLAGNEAVTNGTIDRLEQKTNPPAVTEIKVVDTDTVSNGQADLLEVSGTTEQPNTPVYLRDKDGKVIAQGVSDENKKFTLTAPISADNPMKPEDKFTVTAKENGKAESDAGQKDSQETKVPTLAQDSSAHPFDTTPPAKPEITAQDDGSRAVEIPQDAATATLTLKPAGNEPQKTVEVERGEDGKLKVKEGTNTTPPVTVSEDGNSLIIPKELVQPNAEISAVAKDYAGNSSDAGTDTVKAKTATPTVDADSVKFIDTSKPANTQADEVRLTGKVEGEPAGTKVYLKDANGNILGEGVTKEDKSFEIVGKVDADKPLSKDSLLTVVAQAEGKDPSEKASGEHLKVKEVPNTPDAHPNDAEGPSAPVLASEPGTGAVLVKFPTDANTGDKVVVKFADETATGDNPEPNQTITYTRQPDGTWKADPSGVLSDIVDNTDKPSVLIPENLIKDGSQVKAESVDGIIPTAKKDSNVIIAGNDAKTPTPALVNIQAIDKNAQADIEPDAIKVSGKVSEPIVAGTEIIVYKDGTEIGRTTIQENGTFTLEIPENGRDFKVGDLISVAAKEPTKAVSDGVQKQVPELRANANEDNKDHPNDTTKPLAPTVGVVKDSNDQHEKGDGRVMVSVPENKDNPYVVGDKLEITYVPEGEADTPVTVNLIRQADGSWKSEDEAIVPSIPAGRNSTTISEDIIKDGKEVKARVVDVAGNASDESDTSKTTAPFDDAAAKPTISSIVASDVTPKPQTPPTDGTTAAKPDSNPEKVVLTGELKDPSGQPIANAVIEVRNENNEVIGKAKTNDQGQYKVTLEEIKNGEQPSQDENTGENKVGTDALTANAKLKVVAKVDGQEESAPTEATIPEVLTLALDNNPITGINLDANSNETPEQFEIKGTATVGSVVKAYIQVGDKLVEIGKTEAVPEGGKFTLTTKPLSEIKELPEIKENPQAFEKFKYADGDKTNIILQAVPATETDTTKSPSPQESVSAVKVERGLGDNAANKEKLHPNDKGTVNVVAEPTALPDSFGGAKIQLPDTTGESFLEVILTYTPKKAATTAPSTGDTGQSTGEQPTTGQPAGGTDAGTAQPTVTLTWNGQSWTSSNPDVIPNDAIKSKVENGKTTYTATLAGDKVEDKSTLKAQVQDYAGNKSAEKTVTLNSAAKDEIPERTDVPHLTAGRYEPETGVDGDKANAGDIVAKPGGDNDKVRLKFWKNGEPKEIIIKKDLEAGKWVVDNETETENSVKPNEVNGQPVKAERAQQDTDFILKDDGTVIIKGPSVDDYSPVEAVGYKTVGGESVPSDKPYEKPGETATVEGSNEKAKTVDREVVYALGDDDSPNETDQPKLTKGQDSTEHQGAAFIEPGKDNTEVVVSFNGYSVQQPAETSDGTSTNATIPVVTTATLYKTTVVGVDNTTDTRPQPQTSENVLVARKEHGTWKLYATTKADYEQTYEENGKQLKGKFLTEVSSDIATVDASGKILLKEAAIQDGQQVSAKGFNATRQPAEGKDGDQTITVGNALAPDADVTADSPTITQLTDGKVSVAPGNDNKTVTITYDKPNGDKGTITIEKVDIPEATTENGQPKPTKWVIKPSDNGNTNTTPEGITVDPNTGTVIIPKEQLNVGGKVEATGTDSAQKPNTAKSDLTVVEDATPNSADSATSGLNGDKPTYKPGGDSKEMEFFKHPPVNDDEYSENPTPAAKPESLGKIVKNDEGKWEWADGKQPAGAELNKDTGEVTFPSGGGLSDGEGISATTTDKNGNTSSTEPVVPPKADSSTGTADKPTVTPIKSGDGQGGVKILPGKASETAESDNTSITVSFVKEPPKAEGEATSTTEPNAEALKQEEPDTVITAVKVGNTWKFDTDVDPLVATIDPTTGEITLEAGAVKDGTTVKAVAKDILGNTSAESTGIAPDNPGKVSEANQPTVPEVPKEPETTEPQPPAEPTPAKPSYTEDANAAVVDAPETPTIFKNTGNIGEVEITPGAGVDFISFTATIDNQVKNIAFIKDGDGWEKYVIRLGDDNKNGKLDGNEEVFYDKLDEVVTGNKFTINNITSDKLTDILVGEVGDEYLKPFARPTDDAQDWVVKGGVTTKDAIEFDVKNVQNIAVPERMDVLSNGEFLIAPIFQPEIDSAGNLSVKVTADRTKITAINFEVNTPKEYSEFRTETVKDSRNDIDGWGYRLGNDENPEFISRVNKTDSFYIQNESDSSKLLVNTDPSGKEQDAAKDNNLVYSIAYGMADNPNTKMDDYYKLVNRDPWASASKKIELTDVVISRENAVPRTENNAGSGNNGGTQGGDNGTSTGGGTQGGDNGTSTGGGTGTGTNQPQQPPAPPKPVIGDPTAVKDDQHQGGVKVKPGDNTEKFQVDYQQPNGTNRTVWFKNENGTWKVDPAKHPDANQVNVSTDLNSNSPIKLNSATGEVTFAPSAVRDGSEVTITSLTAEGATIAGKQDSFTAEAEPQPVQPLAQRDDSNKGGAWVQPQDNTNKFKVSYFNDSGRRKYDLVYEKQTNGNWKLSDASKAKLDKDRVPAELRPQLEESTGKVTLHPEAVRDNQYVTITAYNNEGGTVSNKVQTDTDTINYHPLISDNAQANKPSGRIGQEHWRHNRDVYMNEHGQPSHALDDTKYGKFGNSKAVDVNTLSNSEGRDIGRRYSWSEGDDVVGAVDSIGRLSGDSGHYDKLELRFNGGNDLLAIGNDLGTKFPATPTAYRKGNEKLIDLDMGTGNDVVIVGDDNGRFKIMKNKQTGLLDIFNYATTSEYTGNNWDIIPGRDQGQYTLNQKDDWHSGGGKIMNAIVNMGEGDDTLLVLGKISNEAAIQASTINLGNGINHLIVGLNGTDGYHDVQVRSAVESSEIIGGSSADHITAPLFQNYAKLDLKGGNDVVKTNRILNTQVDTGAGDDVMEVQKYAINGQPSMRHDTEIGAGAKVNLGEGNDTFLQGSTWIANGAEILGGRGIDLYRLSGNAKADSSKVKGFERIEFTGNEQFFSLKYADLLNSGVEGPIKIFSSQNSRTNSQVDFGGNSNHWLSNTNGQDNSGGYYDNGNTWKAKGTVRDGGDTYTVYTYNNDSRYEVWIENGITII